jgi:hypothetical protein
VGSFVLQEAFILAAGSIDLGMDLNSNTALDFGLRAGGRQSGCRGDPSHVNF